MIGTPSAPSRRNRTLSNAYLTEPLESRRLLSAGFIYELTSVGIHRYDGIFSKFTPSGTAIPDGDIDVVPPPTAITISGQDIFILSTNAFSPGTTYTGLIGEYTTSGTTVNANLVPAVSNGLSMAMSGSDLFVTLQNGDVAEYTTAGATVNASLISGSNAPGAIAVSGSDLFVRSTAGDGTQKIGEYTTTGSVVNASLITGINTTSGENAIAVIGSNLFVLSSSGVAEYKTAGTLVNAAFVSSTTARSLTVSNSELFVDNGSNILDFSVAGSELNIYPEAATSFGIFAVAPAAPADATGLHLDFAEQPNNTNLMGSSSGTSDITVSLIDQTGELATDATQLVTLGLASGPAGAGVPIIGTTTVPLVDGVAVFSNISVSQPGTYTLIATDGVDLPATSSSAVVAATHVLQTAFVSQPVDVPSPQNTLGTLIVTATDQYGNADSNA